MHAKSHKIIKLIFNAVNCVPLSWITSEKTLNIGKPKTQVINFVCCTENVLTIINLDDVNIVTVQFF